MSLNREATIGIGAFLGATAVCAAQLAGGENDAVATEDSKPRIEIAQSALAPEQTIYEICPESAENSDFSDEIGVAVVALPEVPTISLTREKSNMVKPPRKLGLGNATYAHTESVVLQQPPAVRGQSAPLRMP